MRSTVRWPAITGALPARPGAGLLVLLAVRVGRAAGGRGLKLPVLDGAAVGVCLAGEGGQPVQVLPCAHPRRRVGRAARQQLWHRGLLVSVDGGGLLCRGEGGVPARVVDGGRRLLP
ncbi:hypothetical protein ACIRU3_46245 [Streptomyces sp. NPDC101151]|uniref:hypothetical protein n=1 Tax=Streptomyces sp. NPDC101151 TaxID=3366115 RepID=UPI00382F6BBD